MDIEEIELEEKEYLHISTSNIKNAGKGLFTFIDIYKGELISIFKGEILTEKEAKKRAKKNEDSYFITMLDSSTMDSNYVFCYAKYANDCNGISKTKFKNNSVISINEQGQPCLVATTDIKAGNEIFCSYGKAYWNKIKKLVKIPNI